MTGVVFFMGTPEQYVTNIAFAMKMLFLDPYWSGFPLMPKCVGILAGRSSQITPR